MATYEVAVALRRFGNDPEAPAPSAVRATLPNWPAATAMGRSPR